jgi:hypothetical protein
MKKTLFLVGFLLTIQMQAQKYYAAKLLLVDGEIIEGKATLPTNKVLINNIKIKKDGRKRASLISSENINQILYTLYNGNKYLFERNKIGITPKPFKKQRIGSSFKSEWFLVTFSHPLIKAYVSAQSYYVNKEKGVMETHSYEGRNIIFGTSYLLKRPNEEAPTLMSLSSTTNSKFREWASLYFKENTALVARIKNKEFKVFQIYQLATAYTLYQ